MTYVKEFGKVRKRIRARERGRETEREVEGKQLKKNIQIERQQKKVRKKAERQDNMAEPERQRWTMERQRWTMEDIAMDKLTNKQRERSPKKLFSISNTLRLSVTLAISTDNITIKRYDINYFKTCISIGPGKLLKMQCKVRRIFLRVYLGWHISFWLRIISILLYLNIVVIACVKIAIVTRALERCSSPNAVSR